MNKYQEILKQYWGYDSFRDLQEEIITSIGEGKDPLGLMPTGGGKSITFQVPALAQEGICIVITPLIALMKDQVQNLRKRGIMALAVYSGMTRQEILTALENCIFGDYKFLYISPERVDTEIFRTKLKAMKVSMITVDESHCISQWGYDFRPAYLKIAEIRELLPGVPVLALTATATPEVVKDIQNRLNFHEGNVFRMSFERKNLAYIVRKTDNKTNELLHILRKIPGSAIIYVRNRRRTKEITELLVNEDITADFYHAGLDNAVKDLRQKRWQNGEVRVMVATNAFGMGIDKPDVRIVLHLDLPDSPEAYFQEAGRAGRDGKKAYAVILYAKSDKTTLHKRVADTFPDKEYILDVYEHLQYYYQMAMGDGFQCVREFNLEEFCRKFKYFPVPVDSALKILTQAGYLEYTDEQDNASRILFTIHRDELYKLREMGKETEALIQTILRSYTGVFTDIRELFAQTADAKMKGYGAGRFSFNVKGGRCEACEGDGIIKIEMHFLPDVYVPCEVCGGMRYNRETLEVRYKGKNIYDVLEMTVEEGVEFFSAIPKISRKLETLYEVGLGYVKIGQAATTLSGGEAQRVKLATELSKRATGRTIYILDEPTTGLHTADVHKLIEVLQKLADGGNTVLVIEHNLDVIKTADHIIDLGPEGGDGGGTIVCTGTPEEIAACDRSYTGQYLRKML